MTPAEFSEKRAKGICFWCDEKFKPGHKCKGTKGQIYQLEVQGDEENELEEDEVVEEQKESAAQLAQISRVPLSLISHSNPSTVLSPHLSSPIATQSSRAIVKTSLISPSSLVLSPSAPPPPLHHMQTRSKKAWM